MLVMTLSEHLTTSILDGFQRDMAITWEWKCIFCALLAINMFSLIFQINVPIYAAYLYDAVYTYVQALDKVVRGGGDLRNGTDVISHIRNTTFTSTYFFI